MLVSIEALWGRIERHGDSSEGVGRKALTSLAEAEKARLWAAPVNALRAANIT
jgi:hypothetical protein